MPFDQLMGIHRHLSFQSAPADFAAAGHPGAISIAGPRGRHTRPHLENHIMPGGQHTTPPQRHAAPPTHSERPPLLDAAA
jgi:hypothetical protein